MKNIMRYPGVGGKGYKIKTHDIPAIMADIIVKKAVIFFIRYKKYGNPYGGGFLDWPFWVTDILEAIAEHDG